MSAKGISVARLCAAARRWLGTPYQAGSGVKARGCDCAGFLIGLAVELELDLPPSVTNRAGLVEGVSGLETAPFPTPGQVLLFCPEPASPPSHLALLTPDQTLLHAHWRRGVVENRFGSWFRRRLVSAHNIPGVQQWRP